MNFTGLLFGHFFGDYLLQNKWMTGKGVSHLRCLVHCIIYTFCICFFMWDFQPIWIVIVFVSHYPIDRWSLADKWLKLIKGRSLDTYFYKGHYGRGEVHSNSDIQMNHRILSGGFTALVYAVADNTLHLAIMVYGYKLIIGGS